jgi:putative copper resistance protein D
VAGIELVLMGTALGLAAALARTPPPAAPTPTHGAGHSTLPSAVDPFSLAQLATAWRVNALVLLAIAVAAGAYLVGVRTLARHGRRWPVSRTAMFVTALLVAVVDLCSGVATYAPAMVSVQIAQLLVALLVVPALVALAAPLTLRQEVRDLRGAGGTPTVLDRVAARTLTSPVLGAVAVNVLLLGLYRSSLVELSLRSPWVHLLVLALALAAGFALLCPVLAVDRLPSSSAGVVERMGSLGAVIGCLGILAAQLRYGDRLLAARWFLELRWGWVDPVADQRLGGAIIGVTAAVMVALLAAAVVRRTPPPATSSQRETGQILPITRPSRSSTGTGP